MGKQSSKSKKAGRNANWCKAYRLSETSLINKALRMMRHIRRFKDQSTSDRLAQMPEHIRTHARRKYVEASTQ